MAEQDKQWSADPPGTAKPKPGVESTQAKGKGEWSADPPSNYISGKEGSDWTMNQAADLATHTAEGLWGAVTTPIHLAGKVIDIAGNTEGLSSDIKKTKDLFHETVTGPMESTREKGREMAQSPNRATATMGGLTYAAGLVPVVGPMVGQITSNLGEGNVGAATGDVLGLYLSGKASEWVGKGMQKAGEAAYGASLRLSKQGRMKAGAIIKQGVNERISMDAAGLERAINSISQDAKYRDLITKDPTNPKSFALKTIPIADIKAEFFKHFERLKKPYPKEYAMAVQKIKDWEDALSVTPTAPQSTLYGPNNKPIPTVPPSSFTSVEKVQELKETISTMLQKTSFDPLRKAPEMGMQQWIGVQGEEVMRKTVQDAVNGMTDATNKRMHLHIMLRDAVVDAMSRNPSWINDWAIFAAGAGLERFIAGMAETGVPSGLAAGVVVGALARAAIRSPRVMSRLGIALNAGGIHSSALAPLFQAASAAHLATKSAKEKDEDNPIPTGIPIEFTGTGQPQK